MAAIPLNWRELCSPKKLRLLGAACTCLATVSINANAVVVNTLNGVHYEWLELTETAGMSRILVEQHLSDVSSALYGYEYASRALVEDLLLSYASWDGLNGWHGASAVTSGMDNFLDNFGRLSFTSGLGGRIDTVDGVTASFDSQTTSYGMYGTSNECGSWLTCLGMYSVLSDTNGDATAALQRDIDGWSSTISQPRTTGRTAQSFGTGSLLVRTSVVPAPSAVWLFGSGLLGLVGFAKKKTLRKNPAPH